MDRQLDCDFFFGDNVFQNIKQFDAEKLSGFRNFLKSKKVYHNYVWYKEVWQLLKKEYTHYLVTGDGSIIANWIVGLYAKLTNKKFYFWMHGQHSPDDRLRVKLMNKAFLSLSDGVFLYGEYAIPYLVKAGYPRKKISVIHNSLDTEVQTKYFNSMLESDLYKLHFGNNLPVAIYIGRLQKRKKIDQLLKAVAIANKTESKMNLVLVGPNEDDDNLLKLVNDLSIEKNVWYYGECYDEKTTATLLYNAAVCVCPAAVGLTAIHSLSYGTPVVTNDDKCNQMPEHEAIIEGETGSFFKANDIKSLAECMLYWCSISSGKREIVREKARQTILQEWSVDYQIGVLKQNLI